MQTLTLQPTQGRGGEGHAQKPWCCNFFLLSGGLHYINQDDPVAVTDALLKEGIESYRGATQLRTVSRTKTTPQPAHRVSTDGAAGESEVTLKPSTDHGLQTGPELAVGLSQNLPTGHSRHPRQTTPSPLYFSSSLEESAKPHPEAAKAKKSGSEDDFLYPHNAKYLVDHVLYLPVHKRAPLWFLERVCKAVEKVMKGRIGVKLQKDKTFVLFPSKL